MGLKIFLIATGVYLNSPLWTVLKPPSELEPILSETAECELVTLRDGVSYYEFIEIYLHHSFSSWGNTEGVSQTLLSRERHSFDLLLKVFYSLFLEFQLIILLDNVPH